MPAVPLRQWVLTPPFELRAPLAHERDALAEVGFARRSQSAGASGKSPRVPIKSMGAVARIFADQSCGRIDAAWPQECQRTVRTGRCPAIDAVVGNPPFQSRKFLRDSSVAAVAYIEV